MVGIETLAPRALRGLRFGLARVDGALRQGFAVAWHKLAIGLARAPGALRYGLTAASARLLPRVRRVWNGLRAGTPRGSEPPAPARNPLRLDRAQLRVMLAVAAILAMAALSLLGYGLWARWSGTLADQVAALNLTLAVGTLVAVLIVGIAAWALNATARTMCSAEKVIEIASYALIAAFGLRLVWVKGGAFIRALQASQPVPAIVGVPHHHDHGHHRHDDRHRAVPRAP